jgi:Domain of unknown function (DUF4129)
MIRRLLPVCLLLLCVCSPTIAASARDDPHVQLDQILHRPLYRAWRLREEGGLSDVDAPRTPFASWLNYASNKIDDFYNWLFPATTASTQPVEYGRGELLLDVLKIAGWVAATAGVLFIAVVIAKLIVASRMPASMAQILSRQQIHDALEAGNALALNSSQWLDEAQRLAEDQNFRAVYRALYLALLSGLHSAGKIDHNPNRTNWTYVQHYRGPMQERDLFGRLTDLFDRVWYGHKPVTDQNLPKLRDDVRTLVGTGVG